MLSRIYEPQEGQILIDGVDIATMNLNEYRKNIGIVLQNKFLLSGTIKENITMGNPEFGEEEIIEAAKRANIHDFIQTLPDGYWTDVGQNGVYLSGGEAQRVALARLFLHKPKIVILGFLTSLFSLIRFLVSKIS